MEKKAGAEAIIVVGPFLWKCINCDILMSRQHSIDAHLHRSHHSKLHPPNVITPSQSKHLEEEEEDEITDCRLSTCSCHKLSTTHKVKRKRKKNESRLNRPIKKKKKFSENGEEECCYSEKDKVDDEGGERLDNNSGKISTQLEGIGENVSDSDSCLKDDEHGREMVVKLVRCSMPKREIVQSSSSCSRLDHSEQSGANFNSDGTLDDGGCNRNVSVLPWSSSVKANEKEVAGMVVLGTCSKNRQQWGDGGDSGGVSGAVVVRKSRRSNKGKNSHYKQFDLSNFP